VRGLVEWQRKTRLRAWKKKGRSATTKGNGQSDRLQVNGKRKRKVRTGKASAEKRRVKAQVPQKSEVPGKKRLQFLRNRRGATPTSLRIPRSKVCGSWRRDWPSPSRTPRRGRRPKTVTRRRGSTGKHNSIPKGTYSITLWESRYRLEGCSPMLHNVERKGGKKISGERPEGRQLEKRRVLEQPGGKGSECHHSSCGHL